MNKSERWFFMQKVTSFLNNVNKEMGKVRWPNRREMITYSSATLFFIVVFAMFFTLLDIILAFFKGLV